MSYTHSIPLKFLSIKTTPDININLILILHHQNVEGQSQCDVATKETLGHTFLLVQHWMSITECDSRDLVLSHEEPTSYYILLWQLFTAYNVLKFFWNLGNVIDNNKN
jgi:hypothetical protein